MSKIELKKIHSYFIVLLPYILCLIFFIAYSVLSVVRHNHYQSFGYDLGINDQIVWRYSTFQLPIATMSPLPDKVKLAEHVELIYALLAPFYWIWSARKMLLIVEAGVVCLAGIAVYLLAKKKGVNETGALGTLVAYLGFYGIQNVIWFDAHSASFAAAFLLWFIYFIEIKKKWLSVLFFFLAITAKENIGLLTCLTAFVLLIRSRDQRKLLLFFICASILYVGFIFLVFFPHIIKSEYIYANDSGILSNLNPVSMIDTIEKREAIWYSLLSFGFLPLLSPLSLLPFFADLATYFVVASDLPGAQGLFGQYRVTLVPFLVWASILAIVKYRMLNKWYVGVYLILTTILVQYVLHLPLSYLSKEWFWQEPKSVVTIENIRSKYLPGSASVVAQNNIVPHISHRDKIYSLYPEKKEFINNSPCGEKTCDWFRWYDSPTYLFVDTATDWDARHLLTDRQPFINGLINLEKEGIVEKYKVEGTTILYKVRKKPSSVSSLHNS